MRSAQQEAAERIDGRYDVRVLEPSPPGVDEPPFFADDPVAGGDVAPVARAGTRTWADVCDEAGDPELRAWCEDRWLVRRSLQPLPAGYPATRIALHTLAERVVAPARHAANGKIGLRYTYRGFGTPFFGDRQVRVEDGELLDGDGLRAAAADARHPAPGRRVRRGPSGGRDRRLHADHARRPRRPPHHRPRRGQSGGRLVRLLRLDPRAAAGRRRRGRRLPIAAPAVARALRPRRRPRARRRPGQLRRLAGRRSPPRALPLHRAVGAPRGLLLERALRRLPVLRRDPRRRRPPRVPPAGKGAIDAHERNRVGQGRRRRAGGGTGHHRRRRRPRHLPHPHRRRLRRPRQPLPPPGRTPRRRPDRRRLRDLPVARLRVRPRLRQAAAGVQRRRHRLRRRPAGRRPLRRATGPRGHRLAHGPDGRRAVPVGARHRLRHGRALQSGPGRRPAQGRGGRPHRLRGHPPRGGRRLRGIGLRQGLREAGRLPHHRRAGRHQPAHRPVGRQGRQGADRRPHRPGEEPGHRAGHVPGGRPGLGVQAGGRVEPDGAAAGERHRAGRPGHEARAGGARRGPPDLPRRGPGAARRGEAGGPAHGRTGGGTPDRPAGGRAGPGRRACCRRPRSR